MIHQASREPKEGYARLEIKTYGNYEIYVPMPSSGTHIDQRLVHSVLELVVAECGFERAKVKDEEIFVPSPGGGRHGAERAGGVPSGKDVRKALEGLGYADPVRKR